jgi:hypothetical protein
MPHGPLPPLVVRVCEVPETPVLWDVCADWDDVFWTEYRIGLGGDRNGDARHPDGSFPGDLMVYWNEIAVASPQDIVRAVEAYSRGDGPQGIPLDTFVNEVQRHLDWLRGHWNIWEEDAYFFSVERCICAVSKHPPCVYCNNN